MASSTDQLSATGGEPSRTWPIYQAFTNLPGIGAAYTGRGTSPQNAYFSTSPSRVVPDLLTQNLYHYGNLQGFEPSKLTWPNGGWPHSGHAIIAEEYTWAPHPRTSGIVPFTHDNQPVYYDGIATRSPDYVLSVQGADCPSIFLYDPVSRVIGLSHSGWKPVVRGVVGNMLNIMDKLGAERNNIIVHVAPGVGDTYNEFKWDEEMEPHIKAVFVEAGRADLLTDKTVRHEMTDQECKELGSVVNRDIQSGTSFMLSSLIVRDLTSGGVPSSNITQSLHSTIVDRYPPEETDKTVYFRYHSYRREGQGFGLSMGTAFLEQGN
ncbi:MAG: AP-3 complex subunit beta [Trichoglossum hirsutum]|nr:MAG: AP-3 complex subunit beta [Trichoglossum hirsutum]